MSCLSKSSRHYVYHGMNPLGLTLWFLGCCRLYRAPNGDGFCAVWRAWHPVNWVLAVALVLPCAVLGVPLFQVLNFRLPPQWRKHPEKLEYLTPFSPRRAPALMKLPRRPVHG